MGSNRKKAGQFKAKNVIYNATASKTQLQMDIAAAYPAEAGIKQWIRTMSVEKKLNRLVVKDSYAADGALKELTQTFMTICPADIQQPGKIFFDVAGKKVLMEYDARAWEVKKEEALTHAPDEKRLEDNWRHHTIWRLLLTCKKLSAKGNFTYTFRMAAIAGNDRYEKGNKIYQLTILTFLITRSAQINNHHGCAGHVPSIRWRIGLKKKYFNFRGASQQYKPSARYLRQAHFHQC